MFLSLRIQAIHLAALASVLVHAAALIEIGQRYTAMGRQAETPVVTFQAVITRPRPQPPSPPAKPVRKPAVRKPPEPRIRPKPRPAPAPKPAPARTVQHAPAPPPMPEPVQAPRPSPTAISGMVSVVTLQQDYTQQVLQRIEQHKRYPPAARRRRIAGTVTLTLRLSADGHIEAIHCRSGTPVLCRAAEQAARHAAPFPPLPAGTQHLAFEYRMRFRLH